MKLAIVVDSSCGLTKKEAQERGWFFLPLYIKIDGKEFADGIDLTHENFKDFYSNTSVVSTSCTPPGEALKLFEKLTNEFDFIVVYPISKYLSSQTQNLQVLAKGFKNIFVIDSTNVAQLIVKELVEFEKQVLSNELTVKQGIEKIENLDRSSYPQILLFPKTNDALVKGGRLSPSAAKLAKLFKIVPVIAFQGGKLEKFDKGRIFEKTVINTSSSYYKKINNKFENIYLMFLNLLNPDSNKIFDEIILNSEYKKQPIYFQIPNVIGIHTGFESISVFFSDLELDIKEYKFN